TNVQYKWVKKDVIPDTVTWINAPLNTFNSNDKNVSFSVTNSTDKGIYTLHVKATDYAGNTSTKISEEYNLYNYDILPPTFKVTPETGWVKDKVTLAISHSASETGEEIYYSENPNTDKTTWTKYTVPIEITDHKTIYAYVKSITGKLSAVSNYEIKDRIDKVAPTISIASKSVKTNSIALTATVTDNVVGVDLTALKCKYKKNTGITYTEITADASGNIQIPNLTHNTLYNLELTYTDKAGNVATITDTATTLLLDTPVISIDKTDANWYKQKIATIDYKSHKDNVTYKYKKDAEAEITASITATNLTVPVTFTSNGSISATVTDGTNTLTAYASITNVDSIPPSITVAIANNITAAEANINITSTESLSGIVKYMYRYSNGALPSIWTEKSSTATTIDITLTNLTQLTPYTFEVKAIDKAGNESAVKQVQFTTLEEPPFKPVIAAGLTAIKWNASNAVVTTGDTDPDWFDYQNKKWANTQTEDGSMWTWIPRYAYRIIYYDKPVVDNQVPVGGNIIGYSDNRGLVDASGTADDFFNRLNGRIEIVFLGANNFKYLDGSNYVGDVRKTGGTENPNNYVVHPAFSAVRRTGYYKGSVGNFGWDVEIPGFWVSKFEMATGCTSKTGIPSERSMTASDMFIEGKNISSVRKITGADSMLMKNTQWGAVAYLARAIGKEPNINANGSYTTGGGDYIANVNQSTTGNVTGVYDMSGCAVETMSSYVHLYSTDANIQNLIDNKDSKYVDVYTAGDGNKQAMSYFTNSLKYGDALYETSVNGNSRTGSWNGNYSLYAVGTRPVFFRGGHYGSESLSGLFAFYEDPAQPNTNNGWRRSFHIVVLS
ncbi:MAG: Ig-like domain repeat protein, partial [Clostridia bacterium]